MRSLLLSILLVLPLAGRPAVRKPKPPVTKRAQPLIAALKSKALQGNAKAQFDLGVSYRFGRGVPRNDAEAVKWYRRAAEQGYAKAQYNVGVCYDFGTGIPKDHSEATMWYRKAAEQGHAKAQYNLGVSYKYGQGITRDDVEAYAWLSLAAANGETIALKSRGELEKELSPQDLELAKARARRLMVDLHPKKVKHK